MNRREAAGEGFQRGWNCFKDRDEELSFFRDLKKRDQHQAATLLHPISLEFEPNGSFGLSRISSGGIKGAGLEFLADNGKNDYNWLKTPPATPLFPSLEMEAIGQELVIQRELPIIQPLSRFAGKSEGNNGPITPNPNPKLPQRHKTPTGRPSISSLPEKRNMKTAPVVTQKPNINCTDKMKQVFTPKEKGHSNLPASNMPRSTGIMEPLIRTTMPGVTNETPPNLRTSNRPASATRGRPTYQNQSAPQKQDMHTGTGMNRSASATRGRPTYQNVPAPQKHDANTKIIKRQSCSPSGTRGRKLETDGATRAQVGGNRVQVLGSRMVDKFMNARMSNADDRRARIKLNGSMNESLRSCTGEERQPKIKLNGSLNESSGFGRLMSNNSLDMALKHMEIQRDASNGRKIGMVPGRKS